MKKFVTISQELQKKAQALIKEAQSGGDARETMAKIARLRKDQGGKMEAVLTEDQKKQLKEILGPPFDLGD